MIRSFSLAMLMSAVVAGCQTPPTPNDAADVTSELCLNSQTPENPPVLLGPCKTDTECPSGATCLTNSMGYPGGFCSKDCTISDECDTGTPGVQGVCVRTSAGRKQCMRECLNGFDCGRPGYTCVSNTTSLKICVPSCSVETCGACTRCNEWTGQCQDMSLAFPPAGGLIGTPCTSTGTMSECKSKTCITDRSSNGNYNGWNRGSCIARCALGTGWNSTSFFNDDTFPQGNCPAQSICFPDGDTAEQDPGICLKECRLDADCRLEDGYYCRRTFPRGSRNFTWQNGVCWPIDCVNSSRRCPTGYTCNVRTSTSGGQTTMTGVCQPGTTPPPDAGTDASMTDASGTETGTDASLNDASGAEAGMDATSPDSAFPDAGTTMDVPDGNDSEIPDVSPPDALDATAD